MHSGQRSFRPDAPLPPDSPSGRFIQTKDHTACNFERYAVVPRARIMTTLLLTLRLDANQRDHRDFEQRFLPTRREAIALPRSNTENLMNSRYS